MNIRVTSILVVLGLLSSLMMPITAGAQGGGGGGSGRDQAPGQNRGTSDSNFPVTRLVARGRRAYPPLWAGHYRCH